MTTAVKFRGGTTAEHAVFTGASREITVDTDKNTVIVHDGVTPGGHVLPSPSALAWGAADHYGEDPPEHFTAGTRWADSGLGILRRRNDANTAWVAEAVLFRQSMPIYSAPPANDVGPIYIEGIGPSEWTGAAYERILDAPPEASESTAGVVKLASQAEVNNGSSDGVLTPAQLLGVLVGGVSTPRVQTAAVNNLAITTPKLANGCVTADKLAAGAVPAAIAPGSLNVGMLNTGGAVSWDGSEQSSYFSGPYASAVRAPTNYVVTGMHLSSVWDNNTSESYLQGYVYFRKLKIG